MIIHTASGREITLNVDTPQLLTKHTPKGTLLVEIRDKDGNFIGLVQDPQAILP